MRMWAYPTRPDASGPDAAPAGGAWQRGRGCVLSLLVLFPLAPVLAGEPIDLPSGHQVQFHDTLTDLGLDPAQYRFRFVAPWIDGAGPGLEATSADMQTLCDGFALSHLPETRPETVQIIITLMAEPVPFGVATPGVTQFFEGYRVENARCIWELF